MTKQIIKQYLIDNRDHLIELTKPYTEQYNKLLKELPNEFSTNIEQQYKYALKLIFCKELSDAKLGLSPEEIIMTIEQIDLTYYLECEIINV